MHASRGGAAFAAGHSVNEENAGGAAWSSAGQSFNPEWLPPAVPAADVPATPVEPDVTSPDRQVHVLSDSEDNVSPQAEPRAALHDDDRPSRSRSRERRRHQKRSKERHPTKHRGSHKRRRHRSSAREAPRELGMSEDRLGDSSLVQHESAAFSLNLPSLPTHWSGRAPLVHMLGKGELGASGRAALEQEDAERTLLRQLAHGPAGASSARKQSKPVPSYRYFHASAIPQGLPLSWSHHPKRVRHKPRPPPPPKEASTEMPSLLDHLRSRMGDSVRMGLPSKPAVAAPAPESSSLERFQLGFLPVPRVSSWDTEEQEIAIIQDDMAAQGEQDLIPEDEVISLSTRDRILSWSRPFWLPSDTAVRLHRAALHRLQQSFPRDTSVSLALAWVDGATTATATGGPGAWWGLGQAQSALRTRGSGEKRGEMLWRSRGLRVLEQVSEREPGDAVFPATRLVFLQAPAHRMGLVKGWNTREEEGEAKQGGGVRVATVVEDCLHRREAKLAHWVVSWMALATSWVTPGEASAKNRLAETLSRWRSSECDKDIMTMEVVWLELWDCVDTGHRVRGERETADSLWISWLEWDSFDGADGSHTAAESVPLLEDFWDEEVPRIGEVPCGRGGWNEWVRKNATSFAATEPPASGDNDPKTPVERAAAVAAQAMRSRAEVVARHASAEADAMASTAFCHGIHSDDQRELPIDAMVPEDGVEKATDAGEQEEGVTEEETHWGVLSSLLTRREVPVTSADRPPQPVAPTEASSSLSNSVSVSSRWTGPWREEDITTRSDGRRFVSVYSAVLGHRIPMELAEGAPIEAGAGLPLKSSDRDVYRRARQFLRGQEPGTTGGGSGADPAATKATPARHGVEDSWREWVQMEVFFAASHYRPIRLREGAEAEEAVAISPMRRVSFRQIKPWFDSLAAWKDASRQLSGKIRRQWRQRALRRVWGLVVQPQAAALWDTEELGFPFAGEWHPTGATLSTPSDLFRAVRAWSPWRETTRAPFEQLSGGRLAPLLHRPWELLVDDKFHQQSLQERQWVRRALYRLRNDFPADPWVMRILLEGEGRLAATLIHGEKEQSARLSKRQRANAVLQNLVEVWQRSGRDANDLSVWLSFARATKLVGRQDDTRRTLDRLRRAISADSSSASNASVATPNLLPRLGLAGAEMWVGGAEDSMGGADASHQCIGSGLWVLADTVLRANSSSMSGSNPEKVWKRILRRSQGSAAASLFETEVLTPTLRTRVARDLVALQQRALQAALEIDLSNRDSGHDLDTTLQAMVDWSLVAAQWHWWSALPMDHTWSLNSSHLHLGTMHTSQWNWAVASLLAPLFVVMEASRPPFERGSGSSVPTRGGEWQWKHRWDRGWSLGLGGVVAWLAPDRGTSLRPARASDWECDVGTPNTPWCHMAAWHSPHRTHEWYLWKRTARALWESLSALWLHRAAHGACPHSAVRLCLERALRHHPGHVGLWHEYVQFASGTVPGSGREGGSFPLRAARFLDSLLLQLGCPMWVAVFRAHLSVLVFLRTVRGRGNADTSYHDGGSIASSIGTARSACDVLRRITETPRGRHVPLFWRWLLRLEIACAHPQRAKRTVTRALTACPACRPFVLDCAQRLRPWVDSGDLRQATAQAEVDGAVQWRVPLPPEE